MRRLIKPILLLAIGAWSGLYAGYRYEATRIQQTCEADNGHTVLNGTEYLCLSQRQIEIMKAHNQRGA
jgi:hypothetical protein